MRLKHTHWLEIAGDTRLLEEVSHSAAGATVRDLGRAIKLHHPSATEGLREIETGRVVKAKFPGRYAAYADLPDEDGDPVTMPLAPGTPLWQMLFEAD